MNRSRWALLLLSFSACQTLAGGTEDQFSKDFSCPVDRIEVRDRRDLNTSSFESATPLPNPPADVAADPARLAVWQQNHKSDPNKGDGVHDIEEARGCGKHAFYRCSRLSKHANRVMCGQPAPACPGCDTSQDPRDPRAPVPSGISPW